MADPKGSLNPVTVHFVDTAPAVSQSVPVTAANPLPVVIAAGGADADVNLAAVGGTATAVGSGASSNGTQRVILATDSPGVVPSAAAGVGIANVNSSALATGQVIKNGAGNLYGFTVTTTSVAGYALVFNSTTVPASGAVTPIDAFYVGAFGSVSRTYDPPLVCSTGISIAFSSAVTPFTKTDSATAFISGQAV